MSRESWATYFMGLARGAASRSRDPSTKVGAVIARPNNTIASFGYNDFPRGVRHDAERYADREFKLKAIVHAELNAILNAREPLDACTLYVTFSPCARCAAAIVQAGIRCVVVPASPVPERWKDDVDTAALIFKESGIVVIEHPAAEPQPIGFLKGMTSA